MFVEADRTSKSIMSDIKRSDEKNVSVVIEQVRMKKTLTLFSCVSILCSVTGHISVFVAPTAILRYTGSIGLSLILWLFGGFMNLLLALCFTELATMFPKAGGPYAYVLQVFGPFPGFMIAWGYILLITGPFWAFLSYCASLYIIQPFYSTCQPPDSAVKLLAVWILLSFVAINCVYVKLVTNIQSVLTSTKLLALLLIIICGAISLGTDGPDNISDVWEGTVQQPHLISMAVFFSVFTYGGWQIVVNLMEEVKDPGRDLPRAVYISLSVITIEFVLVNLAYYVVLTKREIVQTATIAVLFFEHFYPPLKPVLSILVAVTTVGVLNASILGHSRVLFAASRNNQAPTFLCMISSRFFTPWPAIFTLCVWSMTMLLSGELFFLMELISLFSILLSLSVVVTLLYLRWTRPEAHRPYKTNICIPVSQLVLVIVVLCLCVYQEPLKLGRGLAILASGIPVYLIGVRWTSKTQIYKKFMGRTVYIAGGCGTVGSGLARQFLMNGAQVAVSSRSQERLDEFKKNLDKALHAKIILIKADASTEAGSECVLAELKKHGGVQHVFATVGGWEVAGPLTKLSVAKLDKDIAERARPHFIIAKTFLPYLANIEGSTYTFISGISAEKCDFPDMAMLIVTGGCQYGISEAARAEFRDSKVAVSEVRMGLFIQPKLEKDIKDKTTNVMGGKVLDVIGHDTLGDFMLEVVLQGRPRDVIRFQTKAEMNAYRKH